MISFKRLATVLHTYITLPYRQWVRKSLFSTFITLFVSFKPLNGKSETTKSIRRPILSFVHYSVGNCLAHRKTDHYARSKKNSNKQSQSSKRLPHEDYECHQ